MGNFEYYIIEPIDSWKNNFALETVVAMHKDDYFHWVDSDLQQCSLGKAYCNVFKRIEEVKYKDE